MFLLRAIRIECLPMERKACPHDLDASHGPSLGSQPSDMRIRGRTTRDLALLLLFTLVLSDRLALAHAVVLQSTPAAQARMPGPDIDVRLRFNSRVDHARSRLMLRLPDKTSRPLTMASDAPPDTLAARAQGLRAGGYILRWQVLAVDGHITRGDIPFQIDGAMGPQASEAGMKISRP